MRGNRRTGRGGRIRRGSIPARAGEPFKSFQPIPLSGVYPRACGGTLLRRSKAFSNGGLSPRVRGNRPGPIIQQGCRGSIPARAGEPSSTGCNASMVWVYPRACGGTERCGVLRVVVLGLSPRVRGNRDIRPVSQIQEGSIPARAGEPVVALERRQDLRVYPRACGGTPAPISNTNKATGLSPRVRGNPRSPRSRAISKGSIPARAGEPK